MGWKNIWQSLKTVDMRKRVFAVLGMIFVFRILAHIPVPLSDPQSLQQVLNNVFNSQDTPQLLSFINVLSGGALAQFSIVLAGLGPYINASIIMQLLTRAIPRLEALNKEGEYGRKKINQYTRLLTFPLAIVQAIGSIYLIRQTAASIGGLSDITANTSLSQWVLMVAAMTGGSMLLMWLGELITEKGIGNGISLIITIGIVSSLPQSIISLIKGSSGSKILIIGVVVLAITIVTMLIVKLNEASRKITINYAKRVQGNRSYGGVTTILPVKLITAGVIPIIFAVAFLSVPTFIGQLMAGSSSLQMQNIGTQLVNIFQSPTATSFSQGGIQPFIYPIVYFLLVFAFTFFYTSIAFNSKEIAENLQKQGGFIADIRSGKQTEKYLTKIVNRLTLFGAACLGLLALLPIIVQVFLDVNVTISGTSILILVSVALETMRQIESRALMVTYNQYNEPDFFYDSSTPAEAATGARRLSFKRFKRPKT
ncbi:MAG TPA: preprotein translocase subunit SecY [Candidatus Saccharimonadales bacterium]|nr:preprotein translocase subunit SecY [Candidatus Saccharimonadales bacterium]